MKTLTLEQMEFLHDMLAEDTALQKRIQAAGEPLLAADEVAQAAKARGVVIEPELLVNFLSAPSPTYQSLTDQELEQVSAGGLKWSGLNVSISSVYACLIISIRAAKAHRSDPSNLGCADTLNLSDAGPAAPGPAG